MRFEMNLLRCALPILAIFSALPAQADCLTDAAAVEAAIAASMGYREIQIINDKDGTIKTFVLDFNGKDKVRLSDYNLAGSVGLSVFIGNRYWDRDKNGKFMENRTSSAAGIAQGMINRKTKIKPTNGKVKCSIEMGDFGENLEKFKWTQKANSFSIDYQLWTDVNSHLPVRQTWDYKGRPDVADSKANIIFQFSNDLSIAEPN
jgi:hypothetical protein